VHWVERPEIRACLNLIKSFPSLEIPPASAVEKAISLINPEDHPDTPERAEAFKKLRLQAATHQGTLEEFIEVLSIQTGLDTYEPDQETVKLLTLHAAKGLEFPIVIIAGCEGNLLPLSLLKESDPEEERRLFYVGLTRAKEKVFLTWAKKRTLLGQNLDQSPSPFLDHIEAILKDQLDVQGVKHPVRPGKRQMSLFGK
jgi:DNA helicase-2/ATP-dependent DNA helicase PcrA